MGFIMRSPAIRRLMSVGLRVCVSKVYEVIRFSNEDVMADPDRVVEQIAKAIEQQRIRRPYRVRRIAGR